MGTCEHAIEIGSPLHTLMMQLLSLFFDLDPFDFHMDLKISER